MKKTIFLSVLAFFLTLCLPAPQSPHSETRRTDVLPDGPSAVQQLFTAGTSSDVNSLPACPVPLPETIRVLHEGETLEMPLENYLCGVLAAEMPASFPEEALKAQAVAARTFAVSSAVSQKHGDAAVCTDFACCQAWRGEEALRESWGGDYDALSQKIRDAVEATRGQILCYENAPVFAAFHSSSAGATEDCGAIWNARPYLVSVPSPETEEDVPNYVSTVRCWAIDFRDTLLSAHPEADFSGPENAWIGELRRDDSGRVAEAVLGGTVISGTELRSLFQLRSTAFELSYSGGEFVFTVTGFGHGVGMSQYGAKVMAESGADYREILAHYYPGTALVLSS